MSNRIYTETDPDFKAGNRLPKQGIPNPWLDFLMLSAIKIHQKGYIL